MSGSLSISELNSGNPAQSNDEIPIARSGVNFRVTAASVAALASGSGPTIQIDGVDAADQALLNLTASPTILFGDNGGGSIEADLDWFGGSANLSSGQLAVAFSPAIPVGQYYVFFQYDSSAGLINPGILSVTYTDNQHFIIKSSSGSDGSFIRYFVLKITTS